MRKTILLSAALACGALTASAQEYFWTGTEYLPVAEIDSITYEALDPQTVMLPEIMAKDENISIFNEALRVTGIDALLYDLIDENYSVGADSVDWTNPALITRVVSEYDNVAYPKQRLKMFTAFVETDEVYNREFANRGFDSSMSNLDKLKKLAADIYDEMYPEDVNITDPTDRRNSLNRFVAYHFLNRYGCYYTLTAVDGPNSLLAKNWDRTKWDIADWYETMMPHSIMKLSFPSGTEEGLYINRRGVQSGPDSRGVMARGSKITPPFQMTVEQTAINGIYYYIDRIIHYGRETQQVVLDERMRFDATTLSPDFMTSGARGHHTRFTLKGEGMYGGSDMANDITNRQTCLGFKGGYVENFEYSDAETHLHVRPRTLSFLAYQGDEVIIKGQSDITIKLPPLPKGTYELRFGTTIGYQSRGICQFYLDGSPCGIPFDMRPVGSDAIIGWRSDWILGYDEQIAEFDESFHNRGWMKGPASYSSASNETTGAGETLFRDSDCTLRKIVCRFDTDGKTDHYLRIQKKDSNTESELSLDYIELCPKAVYDDSWYSEDIY